MKRKVTKARKGMVSSKEMSPSVEWGNGRGSRGHKTDGVQSDCGKNWEDLGLKRLDLTSGKSKP